MQRPWLDRIAAAAATGWMAMAANAGGPLVLGDVAGFEVGPPAMAGTADGATWVAWVSTPCFGDLRVQRIDAAGTLLSPGGLALDLQDDCNSFRALVSPFTDGSVLVASVPHLFPVQRLDATGAPQWGDGVLPSDAWPVGDVLALPGGDALIGWHEGTTIRVARYDASGVAVWPGPAVIATATGSNKRLLALVPDDAGGAFALWSEPFTYVRTIWIARVLDDGTPAWDAPLNVVPIDGPPSATASSRHTDPVAGPDGRGGIVLVWTFGTDSNVAPAPLLMQVVDGDGGPAFELSGRRIATQLTRQYDAVMTRDPASGDVFIAWRDGDFGAFELRAQRMSLAGARRWGDEGIGVTPIGAGVGRFDASWNAGALALPVSDGTTVSVHRVDAAGVVAPVATPIAGPVDAGAVRAIARGAATMVTWVEQPADGQVLATPVCNGPCPVFGDATGDGLVGVDDLVAVIQAWGPCAGCPADVTGDGAVNVDDLNAVIVNWGA